MNCQFAQEAEDFTAELCGSVLITHKTLCIIYLPYSNKENQSFFFFFSSCTNHGVQETEKHFKVKT